MVNRRKKKSKRTALVMGACGFCGRHLTRLLGTLRGLDIVCSDRFPLPCDSSGHHRYVAADFTSREEVRDLVRHVEPDWVFNLAGVTRGKPEALYSVNLMGSIHLLEALRDLSPESRLLLVGSAAEYGPAEPGMLPITEEHPCNPVGHYGLSKLAMTKAALTCARDHGLNVVVARPFNIIGAGMPEGLVISDILKRASEAVLGGGEPVVKAGNLDGIRDFIAVEDVVMAYVHLIAGDFRGEIFNICSGIAISIREIVTRLLELFERPVKVEIDQALVRGGANDISVGSFQKARRAFDFKPTISIDESVRRILDAMRRVPSFTPVGALHALAS